jgi:hypothetical protein
MSAPEPRESIWGQLLHSRDDRFVRVRFLLLAGLLVAGAFLVPKLMNGFATSEPDRPPEPPPELLPAANPNGGLVVEPSELDFGEVWEQQWLDVTLQNPTDRVIEIHGWSGGNRFDVSPQRVTVPARGSAVVRARFDPVVGRQASDVFKVAEIHRQFRPWIVSEPGQHPGWVLTGRVRRAVSVATDSLKLSEKPLRRGGEFPTKSMEVMALRPIKSLTTDSDSEELQVEISGPDIRNWYQVSITPAETIASGGHTFYIGLRAELPDGTIVETDFGVEVSVE